MNYAAHATSSRNQNPADYFYSAATHRSRGVLWLIFTPARIGQSVKFCYLSPGEAIDPCGEDLPGPIVHVLDGFLHLDGTFQITRRLQVPDRKSTRLNSSHRCISYAVFCFKQK